MGIVRKRNGISTTEPKVGVQNSIIMTSNVTGTTAETALSSVFIPANTFQTGDIVVIEARLRKDNSNSTATVRLRAGTTESTSDILVGIYTSTSSTHGFIPITRTLLITGTTNTQMFNTGTSSPSDIGTSSTALVSTSTSINWAIDNYIVATGQMGSASDVMNLLFLYVRKYDETPKRKYNGLAPRLLGKGTPTGTTSTTLTIIQSLNVPADTLADGDIIRMHARFEKTATSSYNIYLYWNTSVSLTGAVLVATGAVVAANTFYCLTRRMIIRSTTTTCMNPSFSVVHDNGDFATTMNALSINRSSNGYLIAAVNRTSSDRVPAGLFNDYIAIET